MLNALFMIFEKVGIALGILLNLDIPIDSGMISSLKVYYFVSLIAVLHIFIKVMKKFFNSDDRPGKGFY